MGGGNSEALVLLYGHDAGCLNQVAGIVGGEVQRATAGASISTVLAARSGGVLFVHRFGATLNARVQMHLGILDGVVARRRAAELDAGADWVVDGVPAHVERDLRM